MGSVFVCSECGHEIATDHERVEWETRSTAYWYCENLVVVEACGARIEKCGAHNYREVSADELV